MADKRQTSISIDTPVFVASLKMAQEEKRDFSFIVERALVGELNRAGIDIAANPDEAEEAADADKLVKLAKRVGIKPAYAAVLKLRRAGRKSA